ncbi:3-hydroxybutyrate dehydrogenase [Priestia megaterium]|uniref:3-hydroxybutyrate dehydrogenase n=1 Tax=Priestia megaterium TaxID=1404 RepID=UPI00367048B7
MKNEQVVLITGAARGIGFEIGEYFAKAGATVVLTDLNEQGVKEAAITLTDKGFKAYGIKADVTKEADIENMIQKTVDQYGRLDVLINNAGMQHVSPLEKFPTEKFELLITIMLTAPFMAIKHVLPIMRKQQFGRIINMASINGVIGFAGKAAYNSAKHGVIGLTKVAALETATDGITVNAIAPGYVDTPLVRNQMQDLAASRNVPVEDVLEEVLLPLVPQKRLLSVEEIANATLFLAKEESKGITGQTILIDGGYTAQ